MRELTARELATIRIDRTASSGLTAEELTIAYYEAYAKLATSKTTQEGYKYALLAYQRFNGKDEPITYCGVRAMVDGLQAEGKKAETINQYIGGLARVLGWAVKAGVCNKNFLDPDLFPRIKTVTKIHQNVTDEMDFDEILSRVTNKRDRAMLVLMGVAGMRKSEIAFLDKSDITKLNDNSYKLLLRNPKNGKQRWAILPSGYSAELEEHLETIDDGAVFTSAQHKKRLNVRSINEIVKKYGKFSPHAYRHRTAEVLFQAGASIDDISEVLGNSPSVCARVYKGIDINRQTATANLLKRGEK